MKKEKLLFYQAYQEFYKMAEKSTAFKHYCIHAFGEDFSQDGFSDVRQLEFILKNVQLEPQSSILDIGCGNGKMLEYLQRTRNVDIWGFDYCQVAIESAKKRLGRNGNFETAVIGEINYPSNKFDYIFSMDTMYFASDMFRFVKQIHEWLKPGGSFVCGYQEGDVMKKTLNSSTTVLAQALKQNGFSYQVMDYTRETYDMLCHKRNVISAMEKEFKKEKLGMWYRVIKSQTDSVLLPYELYKEKNARYIYFMKKE